MYRPLNTTEALIQPRSAEPELLWRDLRAKTCPTRHHRVSWGDPSRLWGHSAQTNFVPADDTKLDGENEVSDQDQMPGDQVDWCTPFSCGTVLSLGNETSAAQAKNMAITSGTREIGARQKLCTTRALDRPIEHTKCRLLRASGRQSGRAGHLLIRIPGLAPVVLLLRLFKLVDQQAGDALRLRSARDTYRLCLLRPSSVLSARRWLALGLCRGRLLCVRVGCICVFSCGHHICAR